MDVARVRAGARANARRGLPPRAFEFGRGVRLAGTNIACDAMASAGELVFISNAQALGPIGRGQRREPRKSFGRQEVLATEATLALLGEAGARLRARALPAPFGRPFTLGDLRVELCPSGHLPGSASLHVESAGRRLLYAGPVRVGAPAFGATAGEVRPADAVCIEGTFGHPRFTLPDPQEALAAVEAFVKESLAAGAAPVLLTPPFGTAMDVAACLQAAGIPLRGHRTIVAAAGSYRHAAGSGQVAAASIARFAGKLATGEALLWPPEARGAPLLGRLTRARFAFVSGYSLDPVALAQVQADVAIPLSNQAGYPDLLAYVQAAGAREVAIHRGHAEELAADLRARGMVAYALGPPRQLALFRA